jgi:hypothetical protein
MAVAASPVPAVPAGRRFLPLLWVHWRQLRGALILLGSVGTALAGALLLRGEQLRMTFAAIAAQHCGSSGTRLCFALENRTGSATSVLGPVALAVVPVLAGVFVGASLFARDLEAHLHWFAFTQGTSRARWALGRILVASAAAAAVSAALGLIGSWSAGAFEAAGSVPRWDSQLFEVTAPALAALTLADLSIGALLGVLLRRTLPAMLAALGTGIGLAVVVYGRLHAWLLALHAAAVVTPPPVVLSCGSACVAMVRPADTWFGNGGYTVGGWFAGTSGHRLGAPAVAALLDRVPRHLALAPRLNQWFAARHVQFWTAYQPGSRYWLFQALNCGVLVLLAAAAAAAAITLIRRRAL